MNLEDISDLLAASANVQTAATQIDKAAHGRPDLEQVARELCTWASVIEIMAVSLRDETK